MNAPAPGTAAQAVEQPIDLRRFHAYLSTLVGDAAIDDPSLCHLTAADLKLATLCDHVPATLREMTTHQLILVELQQPEPCGTSLRALIQSAIIDGRFQILTTAMDCGINSAQPWLVWAAGFKGDESDLIEGLGSITDPHDRSAAACLATCVPNNHRLITVPVLSWFAAPETARAFHSLLIRGLATPNGPDLAAWALTYLGTARGLLFAAPHGTDALVARLVRASTQHPDAIKEAIRPYQEACDEETRLELATRYLAHALRPQAEALIRPIRFLSLFYERAQAILAAGV